MSYSMILAGSFMLMYVFVRAYKNFVFNSDPTVEILEMGRRSIRRGSSFLIQHQHRIMMHHHQRDSYTLLKANNNNETDLLPWTQFCLLHRKQILCNKKKRKYESSALKLLSKIHKQINHYYHWPTYRFRYAWHPRSDSHDHINIRIIFQMYKRHIGISVNTDNHTKKKAVYFTLSFNLQKKKKIIE